MEAKQIPIFQMMMAIFFIVVNMNKKDILLCDGLIEQKLRWRNN